MNSSSSSCKDLNNFKMVESKLNEKDKKINSLNYSIK